jgi:hypothetical protein
LERTLVRLASLFRYSARARINYDLRGLGAWDGLGSPACNQSIWALGPPKKWLRLAIDAAAPLPDYEKKTVVERLVQLKREASIHSGRAYDPTRGGWLTNAVSQQAIAPFHAILASQNPDKHPFILRLMRLVKRLP